MSIAGNTGERLLALRDWMSSDNHEDLVLALHPLATGSLLVAVVLAGVVNSNSLSPQRLSRLSLHLSALAS